MAGKGRQLSSTAAEKVRAGLSPGGHGSGEHEAREGEREENEGAEERYPQTEAKRPTQ